MLRLFLTPRNHIMKRLFDYLLTFSGDALGAFCVLFLPFLLLFIGFGLAVTQ